jgi:hypothetical protein
MMTVTSAVAWVPVGSSSKMTKDPGEAHDGLSSLVRAGRATAIMK